MTENNNKTLSEMKASEKHRIVATLLEINEKVQGEALPDAKLEETGTPGHLKMEWAKASITLEQLNSLKKELGPNFIVRVSPKDKANLLVTIESTVDGFKTLIKTN